MSDGGTFRGGTWDWPRTAAPRDVEAERAATARAVRAEFDRSTHGFLSSKPAPERPFAQSELLVMLELVRAELVKLRLVMEGVQHRGTVTRDDALDDIQRHWNVAAK